MFALSKTLVVAMCIMATSVQAHEFWIDAEDYTVVSGDPVIATFRNGQDMVGSALSFIPNRSERFDMVVDGDVVEVPSRIGNNPAFSVAGLPDGLLTILQETTDSSLTYTAKDGLTGWERFAAFADHKDLGDVAAAQEARGLPLEDPSERYRRFAKALVAVGDGAGEDARRGLRTEFVAGLNPYIDDVSDGLPVQVFLDDMPKANAQIEMFDRAPDGLVEVTIHRADADGRAVLPVVAGHEYLLDSVTLLPLEPENEGDPIWWSLWAALTFAVPEG